MHNALGVVAQLVRASACHAEGRGFEPRQSRQYLPQYSLRFFSCLLFVKMHYNNSEQKKENKHEIQIICCCGVCIGLDGM